MPEAVQILILILFIQIIFISISTIESIFIQEVLVSQ